MIAGGGQDLSLRATGRRAHRPRRNGRGLRATDTALGRTAAAKVLAERYAGDEDLRRRFKNEGRPRPGSPERRSTVTIFDVGEAEGRPFIVMEFLEGGLLEDRLRTCPQPVGDVLRWPSRPQRHSTLAMRRVSSIATSSPGTCCSTSMGPSALPTSELRAPSARPPDADWDRRRDCRLPLAGAGSRGASDVRQRPLRAPPWLPGSSSPGVGRSRRRARPEAVAPRERAHSGHLSGRRASTGARFDLLSGLWRRNRARDTRARGLRRRAADRLRRTLPVQRGACRGCRRSGSSRSRLGPGPCAFGLALLAIGGGLAVGGLLHGDGARGGTWFRRSRRQTVTPTPAPPPPPPPPPPPR